MPSRNTYHLTWVSHTLDEGYFLMAAPPDLEGGVASLGPPAPMQPCCLHVGLLLSAATPTFNVGSCGDTQEGQVMVERSDRMWSTGEGNGKPLQYSCL